MGNSAKTAVNDSESSLFEFENRPSLNKSEKNLADKKLGHESLSVNQNNTAGDATMSASRMGSINQSR